MLFLNMLPSITTSTSIVICLNLILPMPIMKRLNASYKTLDSSLKPRRRPLSRKRWVQAEKDGLKDQLNGAFSQLEKTIATAKEIELDTRRNEIENLIINEIVKRYFYRDGLYDYHIANNAEIAEALEVLNNPKRYNNILK